jgi:hypothetical protein
MYVVNYCVLHFFCQRSLPQAQYQKKIGSQHSKWEIASSPIKSSFHKDTDIGSTYILASQ